MPPDGHSCTSTAASPLRPQAGSQPQLSPAGTGARPTSVASFCPPGRQPQLQVTQQSPTQASQHGELRDLTAAGNGHTTRDPQQPATPSGLRAQQSPGARLHKPTALHFTLRPSTPVRRTNSAADTGDR
ncbi:hypothetical protein NDU88_001852 [Pleurodeles waltl]|uniref:Uncharacterized protein n=1 Tax=Pleurodeles waltl TaxID=8319 RepID=A0AAV7T148_PLEWA|nr:hypothetical protein NDU88_001852 [Pleurodeles waltl]